MHQVVASAEAEVDDAQHPDKEDLENNTSDIKEFTNFEADKASETYSKVTYPHSQDADTVFSGNELA